MKIGITGHTSGIGKGLYDVLGAKHDVQGFSRTNGYDISTTQHEIIEQIKDFDIFINNAQKDNYQTLLFNKIFKLWKNQKKTIVNIGSIVRYSEFDIDKSTYAQNKVNLNRNAIHTILSGNKSCRIITVNPGYVHTQMIANAKVTKNCLTVEELVNVIEYVIELPHHIEVGEINICRTYPN